MTLMRVAALIIILALSLTGCGAASGGDEPNSTSGFEYTSREIPRLLILLPEGLSEFFTDGYEHFMSGIDQYSQDYRFNYEVKRYSGADQRLGTLSSEATAAYDWVYLHMGGEAVGEELAAALDGLADGKKTILFDENVGGYMPDYHVYIDYREMGVNAGGYINDKLTARYGGGALEALCFAADEPWFKLYIDGITAQTGANIEFRFMPAGDGETVIDEHLSSLSPDELGKIGCVISGDAAHAKSAMEAVLAFKGSLNLKVELIAFIGADSEAIEDFLYSPIDQITFDIYPTMMINAAKYVRDVINGNAEAQESITAQLIDKSNVELFRLSDEYLLRYHVQQ